jgi:hypothetical protein
VDPAEVSFVLRGDRQNYGTVRFSKAGTELLTILGRTDIHVIDLKSRASIVTICCSSIYGEVAFGPNDDSIFNAGHWPGAWDKHGHLLRRLTADRQEPTFGPIAIDEEMQTAFMGCIGTNNKINTYAFIAPALCKNLTSSASFPSQAECQFREKFLRVLHRS